jgi:phosphatidylglycerophosphatase A
LVLLALFPSGPWYFPAVVGGVAAASIACVALGRFGERQLGRKDPEAFVLDEVAGTWLAALALTKPPLHWCLAAFALFRYFDIKKPLGIRKLQKYPGGVGILLDDLAAGACALAGVQLCQALVKLWTGA